MIRALAVCLVLSASLSYAERFVVSLGANVGDVTDAPLQFANDDAKRVAAVFVELGQVSKENAVVVLDATAESTLKALNDIATRVRRSGSDASLVIYVSSHAKAGVLHLSGTSLALAELQRVVNDVPAALKIVVVDSCESGATVGLKGGTPGPEYRVALEPESPRGNVFIASSGPSEPSQEWVSLGGSLFTHHWLVGLRGDADAEGDGVVTLSEAYAYAYRRTVAGSVLSGQHPSFELELHGAGEVVLTEPTKGKSVLVLPAPLEGRFVVASLPRPDVVMEVDKQAGRVSRLAIPPGRYRVLKRLGRTVGLLDVELPWGGEASVDEASMLRRAPTEVATKGAFELKPSALVVQGALDSEPLDGTGLRWRVGAAYRVSFGEGFLQAGLGVGATTFRGTALTANETHVAATVSGGYRFLWNPVMPFVGGFISPAVRAQSFVRDDEAEVKRVLRLEPIAPRTTLGVSFGALAGVEIPLPFGLLVLLTGRFEVRALPAVDQPVWTVGGGADVGLGWRF